MAVCNLASIALNKYVLPNKSFDFDKLVEVTGVIVRNLNRIIDINYYPVPEVSKLEFASGRTLSFVTTFPCILRLF